MSIILYYNYTLHYNYTLYNYTLIFKVLRFEFYFIITQEKKEQSR